MNSTHNTSKKRNRDRESIIRIKVKLLKSSVLYSRTDKNVALVAFINSGMTAEHIVHCVYYDSESK